MSDMAVFWLATIAIALAITTMLQVAVLVIMAKLGLKAIRAVEDLGRQIQPIIDKLNRITDDAGRVTSLALGQVEKINALLNGTGKRIEDVVSTLHSTILGPVKHGAAILAGVKAALGVFWSRHDRTRQPRDDEDAMFIG